MPRKVHKCSYDGCDKTFTRSNNLKDHIRTHNDERPYGCPMCQMSFTRKRDCQSHQNTHSVESRYVCDDCGHSFTRSANLKRHYTSAKGTDCARHILENQWLSQAMPSSVNPDGGNALGAQLSGVGLLNAQMPFSPVPPQDQDFSQFRASALVPLSVPRPAHDGFGLSSPPPGKIMADDEPQMYSHDGQKKSRHDEYY